MKVKKPGGGFALPGLRGDSVGPVSAAPPGDFLQRMLSTGDNIVLRIRRQGGEERRVTRDAYNQVTVLVRVFLRLQQRFARDDVVLNMPALMHLEEGAQQHHQLLAIAVVFQR